MVRTVPGDTKLKADPMVLVVVSKEEGEGGGRRGGELDKRGEEPHQWVCN